MTAAIVATTLVLATVALVWAAVEDVRRLVIPNRLVVALVVLFAPYAAASLDPATVAVHLAVAGAVLVGGAGLFALGGIGGGDVKLLAAMALWAGADRLPPLLIATALAGLLVSLAALSAAWWTRTRVGVPAGRAAVPLRKIMIPYGVAIASGGFVVLALIAAPAVR